jgi:uncharacterized membrane protein YccC
MNAFAAALPKLTDWHEGRSAARMLVAAVGAYLLTTIIHLPGPYSAVITTLVVARPHSGGVLRASLERLVATILGAGIACLATFGRLAHIPEIWLMTFTLLPLALAVAHNSGYRTAMIAAMIVLSAPAAAGSPLQIAVVRLLGVSLGAVVGALVSVTVLPSRREVVVARSVARLLADFVELLRSAITIQGGNSHSRDQFELRVRLSLRELGMLIRDRHDAPVARGPAAAMVKFTVQMHADIIFLKRELQRIETLPATAASALEDFARAFDTTTASVAALARGDAEQSDSRKLHEACRAASEALREACPHSEGARLMLRRLIEDLASLGKSIERADGAGVERPTS